MLVRDIEVDVDGGVRGDVGLMLVRYCDWILVDNFVNKLIKVVDNVDNFVYN